MKRLAELLRRRMSGGLTEKEAEELERRLRELAEELPEPPPVEEADQADPTVPGPGDSEGARPE